MGLPANGKGGPIKSRPIVKSELHEILSDKLQLAGTLVPSRASVCPKLHNLALFNHGADSFQVGAIGRWDRSTTIYCAQVNIPAKQVVTGQKSRIQMALSSMTIHELNGVSVVALEGRIRVWRGK